MPAQVTICRNPATGQETGRVPLNTPDDLIEAVAAARQAQPAWAARPVAQRARAMRRVRRYLADNAEELAAVISGDTGKSRLDALITEVVPCAMAAGYYARRARRWLAPRRLPPATRLMAYKRARLHQRPWGVVGIISPWNYPFGIPFSEVVMALMAGNAVILKAASQSQQVAAALATAFAAAELPAGVFRSLNLPGRQAGPGFLAAGVDKLFFTGSVAVGKELMARAAQTLTPLCLELGGNDAMVVCADADLERAAAGAVWCGLSNAGQSCGGVERIYVEARVYQPFLDILAQKVRALRVGPDRDFAVDMGAMTTERQMGTVERHLADALAKGARIYAQSQAPQGPGNFLPATVLCEVDHSMEVMRAETFGPLLAVMAVDGEEEALALANDSDLGLTGSVWSRDRRRARALAARIQAGAVLINDHLMSHGLAEAPWGGMKQSGLGRSHGRLGFAEMTQPQVVVDDLLPRARRQMWYYPHDRSLYQGFLGMLSFLFGRGWGRRLAGGLRLLRVFARSWHN